MKELGKGDENDLSVSPSQVDLSAVNTSQQEAVDLDNTESWIGKKVSVWYQNVRSYYTGKIVKRNYTTGEFTLEWGSGEELTETELTKHNMTHNPNNPDRWHFTQNDMSTTTTTTTNPPGEENETIVPSTPPGIKTPPASITPITSPSLSSSNSSISPLSDK